MKIAFVGTNSNDISSKLIKWFTGSKWTHVMLVLDDTVDGDSIVVESSAKHGVSLNLLSKFSGRPIEIYQDTLDLWDINPIKPIIGNNYGYLQLFGIALVKLFKLKKNPFNSNQVCSELVLEWLINSPYAEKFKHLDPNITSPGDLHKIISKDLSFKLLT